MSIVFDHRDAGTAESAWQAAAPWRGLPELSLAVDRVIVVAAHPDDETLGAAGLIATAGARGIPVTVLVLTDGQASHPDETADIVRVRRRESVDALSELAESVSLHFAGLPDGSLRERRPEVRSALAAALGDAAGTRTLLAVPWWGDGHRDHRIAGEIACGFSAAGVQVVGYPIWMWHWSTPDAVDARPWRALSLTPELVEAKRRAIAHHSSQLIPNGADEPIVHAGMRAHFERDAEVFIDASAALEGSGVSPEWFAEFYARHEDPWGLESRWYEQRKRDVLMATLPKQRHARTLELGCATGMLTERLAARSDHVTAVDVVPRALEKARGRVVGDVTFELRRLPDEWPDGTFDLIVLSELAYYWSPQELSDALTLAHRSLSDDGVLVACHWRPRIDGCALDGDGVHAAIATGGLFHRSIHHLEEAFVLDLFVPVGDRFGR